MNRTLRALAIGALALSLAPLSTLVDMPEAEAQKSRKYKRSGPKVKVKVRQTDRTKGLTDKSAEKEKKERAPDVTAEDVLEIQGAVKEIRSSQIRKYKRLIAATDPDNSEMPELLFRLADLYSRQQRYWRFKAFELYEKIEDPKNKRKKNQLKSEQRKRFKKEKEFLTEAIKVYSVLTSNNKYRNYPRMDQALFFYAYTLRSSKRIDLARSVFKKLIQNYPRSKYVPDAYLAFADYYFEQSDLPKAELFYDKVLQFPKSGSYDYALYKKGWVYLNQDRNRDALSTFFSVSQRTNGKKKKAQLNKASKKDYVRAYAEVGKAQKAYVAFQRVDKSYAYKMLRILAFLYFDQGKPEKAIYTFRELMKIQPRNKEVCEYQFNVVQAMLSAGGYKEKATEVDKLNKIYRNHADKKVISGSTLTECRENAELTTSELAKLWHLEATKTLNAETLGHAERLYKSYVQYHPKAKDIGEMQYYYAELLWERAEKEANQRIAVERWTKAANAFDAVLVSGKVNKKLQKESAYAQVLAWKNALKVDPRNTVVPEPGDKASKPKPREISGPEKKMLAAFDKYIKYIKDPKDDELVQMKFFKARIYWKHDQLDKAIPLFEDILDKHETHETALYSANILLDSLNRLGRYDDMLANVDRMLKKEKFLEGKDDLRSRLKFLKAQSRRKAAEELDKAGKFVECGLRYQEIYNDNVDGKGMDEVLYNGATCFRRGKSVGLAIVLYATLKKKFPDSNHTQKALSAMGDAFGEVAMYKRSAAVYEEYAKKYAGEKDARTAMSNAVTYRLGIGDDDQAIKNIEYFLRQGKWVKKNQKEAADALLGLVNIYDKRGNEGMVVKTLQRYIKTMKTKAGRERLVMAHGRIGEILWKQSCKTATDDGACVRITRDRATRRRKKRRRRRAVLPERCGDDDSKIKLTVLDRDKRLVKKAQAHFRSAMKEWGKVDKSDKNDPMVAVAANWNAASMFYLSEEKYENYLRIQIPTKLDFNPQKPKVAEKSVKRFMDWKKKKEAVAAATKQDYMNVVGAGSASWAVAAAARAGQVFQNFADQLFAAKVPKFVRSGKFAQDGWDAYCDQLAEVATPLEDASIAAFGFCLNETTKRNWFNQWSKMCERELGQIRPQDYPTANEVHAEAVLVGDITDVQGIMSRIEK